MWVLKANTNSCSEIWFIFYFVQKQENTLTKPRLPFKRPFCLTKMLYNMHILVLNQLKPSTSQACLHKYISPFCQVCDGRLCGECGPNCRVRRTAVKNESELFIFDCTKYNQSKRETKIKPTKTKHKVPGTRKPETWNMTDDEHDKDLTRDKGRLT